MNTTIPQGVHGCYCEDCSGNRIRVAAEPAGPERRIIPQWAQRRFRLRRTGDVVLRRNS